MHEEAALVPLLIASGVAVGLGFEIERRRNRLRLVFDTFDRQEYRIADALERLVQSGELKPYQPGLEPA